MTSRAPHTIRPAEPRDVPAIVGLIHELAAFERLSTFCVATPERLAPQLFGPRPAAEALVVEVDAAEAGGESAIGTAATASATADDRTIVAFALYFTNFSTFLAQPGLYLEDLYVRPAHRGQGIASALMRRLAAMAVARDCGRFDWSVLDWNAPAIGFYERIGAAVLPDWRTCRLTGEALQRLAANGR